MKKGENDKTYFCRRNDVLAFVYWTEAREYIPHGRFIYNEVVTIKRGPGERSTCSAKDLAKLIAASDAARHTGFRPITVREAVEGFLKSKEAISRKQLSKYRSILGYLVDKYGGKQTTELTPIRIQAFLRGLTRQMKLDARQRAAQKHNKPKEL